MFHLFLENYESLSYMKGTGCIKIKLTKELEYCIPGTTKYLQYLNSLGSSVISTSLDIWTIFYKAEYFLVLWVIIKKYISAAFVKFVNKSHTLLSCFFQVLCS